MNLEQLQFENSFLEDLPGDLSGDVRPRTTPGVLYSLVSPSPVQRPQLLCGSNEAIQLLELSEENFSEAKFAQVFSGNERLKGMKPFASRYGGHQFGYWAHQLGDGRAISLGDVVTSLGQRWELQLKGAGRTPYSRRGDGRAVLRSSLREFLCSEAMFHLRVPTTRALCCVLTGEEVVRDMFYDGNPISEPGAITTRMAPSFLRFGHFQILAADKETSLLKNLVNYAIQTHFPNHSAESEESLGGWFSEICRLTAKLMVEWQRVGFVHAVMNTDNMSLLGLTIDYGPYGWMEGYDPHWTPNTSDHEQKRYRFAAQPQVALWNLARLAESLVLLVENKNIFESGLELYQRNFHEDYLQMRGHKLGLREIKGDSDLDLLQELEAVLTADEIDMTLFYRTLSEVEDVVDFEKLRWTYYSESPSNKALDSMKQWLVKYLKRRELELKTTSRKESLELMNQNNPVFILRNYLVQQALDELQSGSRSLLEALLQAQKTPYELNSNTRPFFVKRPEWARHRPGCSTLSCSS